LIYKTLFLVFLFSSSILLSQTEIDITFDSDGLQIEGTLALPEGDGPFPCLVLVHGSGANDRDQTITLSGGNAVCLYPELLGQTIRNFKDISDFLSVNDIAVLRYDKRSFTHGPNLNPVTITPNDFITDAGNAVDFLISHDNIDNDCIILGGHSQGSTLIPVLGKERDDIAGLISLAGPVTTIDTLLAEQFRNLFEICASDPITGNDIANQIYDEFSLLFDGQISQNVPLEIQIPGNPPQDFPLGFPIFFADWHELGTNVIQNYNDADIPLLFLQGTNDFNVPFENANRFENSLTNEAVQVNLFDDVNHFLTPNDSPLVSQPLLDTLKNWILNLKDFTTSTQILENKSSVLIQRQQNLLRIEVGPFKENITVIVSDFLGQILKRETLKNSTHDIPLSDIYANEIIVAIFHENRLIASKKIIEIEKN